MDLKTPDALHQLQASGLACPWDFQGKNGHKLTPKNASQVAKLLQWCQSQNQPVAFHPTDAVLLDKPLWLDCAALNQVRQHSVADFVIQVECGMTYRELLATVAPHRQTWPLSYPPNLTLGEILAEERPALETGLRGYPRDYVLKTELATPDGQVTISGADVVKNVTGYDLAKLHIGGFHQFGVLTSVTLKLAALPELRQQWRFEPDSLHTAFHQLEQLLSSGLPLSICELFQQNGHWHILIELAGDEPILKASEAMLQALHPLAASPLDTRSGQALIFELQQFPPHQTIIEIAFPLSQWQGFVSQISKQASLGQARIQVRPAAGLVYIYGTQFPFAALRYLKEQAQTHQGTLQLMRIAPGDVTTRSDAAQAYAEFNRTDDPIVRLLLRDLKTSYDPNNVLFAPPFTFN